MAFRNSSVNRQNSDLNLYPLYASKTQLAENRGCDTNEFLKVQTDTIPQFQLALNITGGSDTLQLRIYDTDDSVVQTINDATLQNYIFQSAETSADYLIINSTFNSSEISTLANGTYRIEVDNDGFTIYGDYFKVVDPLEDQTCSQWFELKLSNDCLEYENEYFSDSDVATQDETLLFPYSDVTIQTSYEYQEEGIENGKGEFKPTLRRQTKKYTLKIPVPYYAVGALEFASLAETVTLRNNYDLDPWQIKNIEIEIDPDFDQSCYNLMSFTFEVGETRNRAVYNSGSCCDVDIYTGTVLEDVVSNECETFVREGCDFEVEITSSTSAGTGGTGVGIVITANVYDKNTTNAYTPSGTLQYTWKRVNNGDCECETLADTDNDVIIRDDGVIPPIDNKGKYICIVEDDGTGCRMSDQYNYQNNCRSGDTIYTPDNPDCDAFSTELTYNATNKQLTSTAQNVPSGETASYEWYYTDNNGNTSKLSDTSQTIGLSTNYGDYTSVVTAGDCQTRSTYTHTDECQGFRFTKNVEGDSITYTPPSGYSPSYAWVYIDEAGTRTSLGTTTATHVAADTGYYEMTATDGDCEYINQSYVIVEDCTGKSVSISTSGNTLTASASGFSGSETYAWYIDTGGGETSLSSTGTSHEATQTGNFIVKVTEGACTVEANQVMIISEECCDFSISIAESGANLEATVSNEPSGCDVEVKWYIWNGVNWVYKQTGNTHTPSSEGIFKAEVICDGCSVYDIYDYDL